MKIVKSRPNVERKTDKDSLGIFAIAVENNIVKVIWINSMTLNYPDLMEFKNLGNINLTPSMDFIITDLDEISVFKFEPQLSLYQNRACCLTTLKIDDWPQLWFNPTNGHVDAPLDLIYLLRSWFRAFKRDLVLLESRTFTLTDKLEPMPELTQPAWQQKSGIGSLGSFGLGLVSTFFGSTAAHAVEDLGWNALEKLSTVTTFAKDTTSYYF